MLTFIDETIDDRNWSGRVGLEPEELTAYEVGFKRSSGNAYLNAAVFYYDYSDIQTFIAVDIGPFIIQRLGNVDEATVYGVDLEATRAPTAHLTLQGSVGWLDIELGAFRTLTGDVPKGKKLPNAPDLTLGALARYETDFSATLGGSIQIDGSYSDGVFKDAINDPQGLNTGLGAGNRNYNAPRTYGASFTYRW